MVRHSGTQLKGQYFHVDRTIFCRPGEEAQRKQLKELIEAMGGNIAYEVADADIILVHPARTKHDAAFPHVRGVVANYHYVEDCFEEKETLPISKYLVVLRQPSPLDVDAEIEVEIEGTHSPEGRRANNEEHQSHPPKALADSGPVTDDDVRGSPSPSSVTLRSTRTTDDGASLEPFDVPETPPIPTFRMPLHNEAFSHQDVCDWVLEFMRWYTTYTPTARTRTDTMLVRGASALLAKIAPQLYKTTFQNVFAKGGEFSEKVLQAIHSAKVLAERHSVKPMLAKHMDVLVKKAAKEYKNEYTPSAQSGSPSPSPTPVETRPPDMQASADLLRPPQPPAGSIFHRGGGGEKRRATEAGHKYLRQLWRWLLLRDPSQKRRDMAKDAAAISKGSLSQRAFDDHRKENKAEFQKTKDEFEADPTQFRRDYDLTNSESRPEAAPDTPVREPARKRRRVEPRKPGRANAAQPRGENGQFMSASTRRGRRPEDARSSLSTLSSSRSSSVSDSDYYG